MKTFKRVCAGLVAILVIGIVGVASLSLIPNPNGLKAQKVSRAVLSLPPGSSKAQVAAFLQNEELEYSYIGDKEGIDFTSSVSDNGYSSANLSGYIVTIIRDTSRGFLVSGDVQYYFFFDKKGKLLKAIAKEIFTGP